MAPAPITPNLVTASELPIQPPRTVRRVSYRRLIICRAIRYWRAPLGRGRWDTENDAGRGAAPHGAGRWRRRGLHRSRAPHGCRTRRTDRTGLRSVLRGPRAVTPVRRRALRPASLPLLRDLRRDVPRRSRPGRGRAHAFRHGRGTEPPALPRRQGRPRGGVSRRVGQTRDPRPRRGPEPRGPRRRHGHALRRHLQLQRLPHGEGSPAPRAFGRLRRRPARDRRVHPGLARRARRAGRQPAGGMAHRPRAFRVGRLHG